jgi:hypothetical protein
MIVFYIGFFTVGIVGIIKSILDISHALDSVEWPKIESTIIELSVHSSTINTETTLETHYFPKIVYQYKYNERIYFGDKIKCGPAYSLFSKSSAQEIINRFKKDQIVQVSVNPNNPKVSVLYPGFASYIYILLIFYFLVFGAGIYLYLRFAV